MRRLIGSWLWVVLLAVPLVVWWWERPAPAGGIVVLPGAELSGTELHLVVVGVDAGGRSGTVQEKIDEVLRRGGLPVVAHPWDGRLFCTPEQLRLLEGAFGLEVLPGDTTALAIWDCLLGERVRLRKPPVWGVCSDDSHEEASMGCRLVVARCAGKDSRSVLAALQAGRFYATTGPLLQHVGCQEGQVVIEAEQRGEVRFVGRGGRVLARVAARRATYAPRGDEGYIRAEVEIPGCGSVFTQPFFVDGPGQVRDPYDGEGLWLRGNLHCHSTRSDGALPFRAVVEWYARHGFGFVSVTDHVPCEWTGLSTIVDTGNDPGPVTGVRCPTWNWPAR